MEMKPTVDRFAELVAKLTSTLGRIEKENFLRELLGSEPDAEDLFKNADTEVLEVLKFLFNPFIVTGISDKKLKKHRTVEELPLVKMSEDSTQGVPNITLTELLEYYKKNNTGRDEDVKFLVKNAVNLSHGEKSLEELVYSTVKKDLKLGIQSTTLNKVFGAGFVPKFDIMLAEGYADNHSHVEGKDFIITQKLDGIRCILVFDPSPAFFSRSGQAILDMTELTAQANSMPKKITINSETFNPQDFVFDGELLLDNPENLKSEDLYRQTVKVTNKDGAKTGLYFNIFDTADKTGFFAGTDSQPCIERKKRTAELIDYLHGKNLCKNFVAVPMLYTGNDTAKITEHLQDCVTSGAEGIMLNIADAPYECKRTKNLLKVKLFNSVDVLVTDLEEGTGANRGKLGAVLVKFIGPDGKDYTCRVGSGFKLEERENFWQNPEAIRGKIIEIGYFELSRNQNDKNYSLRFPTFKHLRLDKDEISMH